MSIGYLRGTHSENCPVRKEILSKKCHARRDLLGIRTVANNETFLCEQIDMLMNKRSPEQVWLTPREKKLLKYITDGYPNSEIADLMFLAVDTTNNYRKKLLFKLNARNTAVLVRIAMEQKLV